MTIWAAIPVKPLAEGKSRLAGALSGPARERLNARMFRRTLAAVTAVVAPDRVIVVSRDAALLRAARELGANALAERGQAMNDALNAVLPLPPGDALLAISADLPELGAEDVAAMLPRADAAGPMVGIAPDRLRLGTNALFCAPAGCIPFRFGEDSFARHSRAARDAGIEPRIVDRPGLAFDLDLPEDLARYAGAWLEA